MSKWAEIDKQLHDRHVESSLSREAVLAEFYMGVLVRVWENYKLAGLDELAEDLLLLLKVTTAFWGPTCSVAAGVMIAEICKKHDWLND